MSIQKGKNQEVEKSPDVTVTAATGQDIHELETEMPYGPSNYHQDKLLKQEKGTSVYLVARQGTELAGHAELILGGPNESEVHEVLAGIPEINGAEIKPEMRSLGIGTEIIHTAEQTAIEKGYKQICLAVIENNPRARKLYEKLGYTSRNLPKHIVKTPSGSTLFCDYLVKDL